MRKVSWLWSVGVLISVLSLAAVSACQRAPEAVSAPAAEHPEYAPTATVKDLMLSIVDPSADVVWLSVTTVQNEKGIIETKPTKDEEWVKVRHGAIALAEAANLLMMPGRHVAGPGEKSETPGIELEPSEMEALIDKDRASWNMRAKGLHDASMAALQAIDAHDADKVFEVGERIERACESCHSQYWYPNEKIPAFPPDPPRSE